MYTKKDLIEKAIQNLTYFNSDRLEWNDFAIINHLPTSNQYENFFQMNWKSLIKLVQKKSTLNSASRYTKAELELYSLPVKFYNKEILLNLTKEIPKEYFRTKAKWNRYADENALPRVNIFINRFGTWEKFLNEIGVKNEKYVRYSKEILIKIANEHAEHFSGIHVWNKYAKANKLPCNKAYSYHFGSWNNARQEMGFKINRKGKKFNLNEQEFIKIAKKHITPDMTIQEWNEYAKKFSLPCIATIQKYFNLDWYTLKKIAGLDNVRCKRFDKISRSKEDLWEILKTYKKNLASIETWNRFAKKELLPNTVGLSKIFDMDWPRIKEKILNEKTPSIRKWTDDELIAIFNEHKHALTTASEYTIYAKKHELPTTVTIAKRFGSFNNLKMMLGLPIRSYRKKNKTLVS